MVDGIVMRVGLIFVSNVGVWVVGSDLVFVVKVLGGWLWLVVGVFWEKFTIGELVESKLRNRGISFDNGLVTSSSFIGAVAVFNDSHVVFIFVYCVVWGVVVLLFFAWGKFLLFGVVMDVLFFWLWRLFLMELVVLWVVDGVTIDWLGWLFIESVWFEEVTEFVVSVLFFNVDIIVLEFRNVWQELWESPGGWSSLEWLWLAEVNLGWSGVMEMVVPVSWCWFPWVCVCVFIMRIVLEVGVVDL